MLWAWRFYISSHWQGHRHPPSGFNPTGIQIKMPWGRAFTSLARSSAFSIRVLSYRDFFQVAIAQRMVHYKLPSVSWHNYREIEPIALASTLARILSILASTLDRCICPLPCPYCSCRLNRKSNRATLQLWTQHPQGKCFGLLFCNSFIFACFIFATWLLLHLARGC